MATIQLPLFLKLAEAGSSALPEWKHILGSNGPVVGWAFDAATLEQIYFQIPLLAYGSGNLTLRYVWYADTASSGAVIWGAQIAAITSNTDTQDVETKAYATAQTVTDTHLGTTGQRMHDIDLTISNLDSAAANDLIFLRVYRDAAAGGDTMAGDAILTMLTLSYSDT